VTGTAPASWTCNAGLYGNGIACNCDCGASDPDCANVTLPVEGCEVGALGCDAVGLCVYPEICVPQCEGRECGSDRCDGSCGFCSSADFCSANGECLPRVIGGDGDGDDDDTVISGCAACATEGPPVSAALVGVAIGLSFSRRRRSAA
jgi:MYXO-CTERM domain-containing protein